MSPFSPFSPFSPGGPAGPGSPFSPISPFSPLTSLTPSEQPTKASAAAKIAIEALAKIGAEPGRAVDIVENALTAIEVILRPSELAERVGSTPAGGILPEGATPKHASPTSPNSNHSGSDTGAARVSSRKNPPREMHVGLAPPPSPLPQAAAERRTGLIQHPNEKGDAGYADRISRSRDC